MKRTATTIQWAAGILAAVSVTLAGLSWHAATAAPAIASVVVAALCWTIADTGRSARLGTLIKASAISSMDCCKTKQYTWQVLSGYQKVVAILPPTVVERRMETRLRRQQLHRFAEVSDLPNVSARILSLNVPYHLAVDNFSILRFGKEHETTLRDVASSEILKDQLHLKDQHIRVQPSFRRVADP
ncbi:MAG TPA: Scr1 family TA system antitoxin-like transcriptional regulator [Streptosporangiaceae bacterium]|nr:Scr1 family TA system antitoxin-like transcriptional regulator [Streptosporangiaceae bacterium]